MITITLIVWYLLGLIGCILLEYNDYKKGVADRMTVKILLQIITYSFLFGIGMLVFAIKELWVPNWRDIILWKYSNFEE